MKRGLVRSLVLLALAAALVATASSSQAASEGPIRILLVLATWGPEPYSAADARSVITDTASFISTASYGKATLVHRTTPWLRAFAERPRGCELGPIGATVQAEAERAGYRYADYDLVAIGVPPLECIWRGAYFEPGIWLNGRIDRRLIAHELGHHFGVFEEGPAWVCELHYCVMENYANLYSVMGDGESDYSAYEKVMFGWIGPEKVAPARIGPVSIGAIDRPSPYAQTLRVVTAANEFWFEYRPAQPKWAYGTRDGIPGVVVHGGANELEARPSVFFARNVLMLDPAGTGLPAMSRGQVFRRAGIFSVKVTATAAESAKLTFRWLDKGRPSAPRLPFPRDLESSRPTVRWSPADDAGSGIAHYDVYVDGRFYRRVSAVARLGYRIVPRDTSLAIPGVSAGTHRIRVVAVDRAGNRSRAAVQAYHVG